MSEPFPIVKRGLLAWPQELNPYVTEGTHERVELRTYLDRNRPFFPYLHDEVIEQWIYRHWEQSPYTHVPLTDLRSEKVAWTTEEFLEKVGVGDDYSDEIGDSEVIKKYWQRLLQVRPFKNMWEVGTWDFPPVVLHSAAGFIGLSGELLAHKYWLIEGHQRYRGLNYLSYNGRAQRQHQIYLLQWPPGFPSCGAN